MNFLHKNHPIHLTPTAYGSDEQAQKPRQRKPDVISTRKRTKSVVTRVQITAKETLTPGWILGDCMTATRGHGGPGRCFENGGGRGGRRGMPPCCGVPEATGGDPTKQLIVS